MKQLKFLETKRTPHYSLRKFSVGMVSVLLGVTIFGINFTDHSVKAATIESVENSNSSANSRLQQTSAVGNTTAEQTNTQKTTSATQKVQQSSASKNATANNSTEAATTPQSSPETQGSADTDIKSSTAKSVATNLVTISGTDRNAAGTVDQNNTNTQQATSAKEKVQQNSASNDATANNSTEAATTSQSAPKTQGSADTYIRSLAAKSAAKLAAKNLLAMNLVKNPGTDIKSLAARLAVTNLAANPGTVDQNGNNTQPAKENQDLANKTKLTSSDNYSSNIYKGTDGNYYKIVTIGGQDYVYHAADIQANGTNILGYVKGTADDNKNNINISKKDLGNGKTRWTVVFFPNKGLQNYGGTVHGLISAKFGIALTSDYQIVGKVDMEVITDPKKSFLAYTFEPGNYSAAEHTVKKISPEVDFSFDPKKDVDPNTGLINNSKTMPAYNNEYLQGPYYFTTATDTGAKNLWRTYFEYNGENKNAYDGSPYLGNNHDLNFNIFKIANETGVDGAKYADSIIYDTANSKGVFSSDNFTQAIEFKSQGYQSKLAWVDLSQYSSYVISFTTQHTDSHEVGLATGSKNQQFSGISANIYSKQNTYWNMYSSLYGEQRALDTDGIPLKAENIIPNWDAKKAANKVVDDAVAKQKELITKANNLSDKDKQALNDQMDAAANTAKKAIDAATTNDGATKAGQDGVAAIEKAVPTSLEDAKTALTDAISKGEAAQKSDSYYNDANDGDKTALDNALSKATEDLKKNPLTQATADQDAQAIKDAINGLKGQPTNLDKLNQAISKGTSAQAGSKYANSSDESKAALDQAINAGQTAKTQSGLTQKEADEDASAIETAIKGLSGKDTDKTALTDAISKGEAAQKSDSYYNDANDGDKTALDNALSKATEDLKKNPLTQATADQDAQAIKDAINGLKGQPTNLDKLNQAISKGTSAQAGSKYANSSDESKAALDQAINAGQTAKTQSGLTQKEADEDASAIETAIKGLSGKDTDKTALTDAISKGEAAQKSDSYYNDANDGDKTALDNALSKATEDLKKNPLTQATADQDAQAIKDAINGLKGQPTNLDKLNQAISKGTSAQAGSKYANSSDESKAALDQAINAGQTAKTQSGLTQKEADEDASAIETAIKGLSGKDTDKTALTDAISKGEAAQKSDSYYNDANDGDKTALDNALSKATEDLKKNPLTQATADQDAQAIKDAINGLKGQPTNLDKLNQAISKGTSAQAGSKYANSSDESKAALDQAINAGQTAKTQSGLTQKEADEDASAIETAIKGLSGKDTDKTALTDAISKGEAAQKSDSYYNDANDGDKTALDNALSKATEDLKKNPLTQATADQDAQAIKDAINGLKGQPTNLDKLNQAISKGTSAQAGSKYANSSDESKAALDQAINAGQTAKTQSGLTQKEADEDASAIETAIKGLSGKDTDKTALTDAISKGEAAQKSDSYYNDANDGDKTALDNALSKATEDLKKNPLTQATADQDAQAIKDAINGLKGQPTNLDKLNQAISKGTSAQAGSKYANSSDESKAALDQAINAGQTAKTQSGLTQKEADEDASAIETAIKGLSGKDTDKTALTDAISKGEAAQKSDSYYNDANDGDKTALDNALSKATEDLKKNPLTQATADQDAQAIKDAINGLKGQPTNLDKLNQAISKGTSAQAGSKYANSSDESKAALDQAINAGQTAKTQSGLTQKEADEDASAIETAIKGLSGKDTDKTALTDAISKGEAAQKSDSYYNDANDGDKTALDNALSKATEDLKKNPLTQATADQDAQAIKDAINGLKGQPTNLDKLNQAISKGTSAQAGSKYANSSDESKAALDQAINAGQTAKTQSGLTQKEADEDASAIETAIKGLSGKDTDKTALTDAISKGEAAQKSDSYYNDANDGDKTALDNALSKATEDLKKNPLTQATADQDAQAIKDAINGLKGQPTNLDKLNQAISKGTSAQAGSKYANSSDESKAALDQAINAGQTAKTQSGLTQKEADEDASAIETAIKGLSGKDTDKTALTDAISKGEAAQKSDSYYNDANDGDKTALDNALSKATEDLKKNPLTQATADQDAQAIKDAINGLKGQPTNLDKLNQAISKGTSAQAGSKYANSSDESKAALDQAINAGQTAKTQSGLTQKEADEDASAIETAIKGLSGKDTDKTALTDAISKGEAAQKSDSYYNDANDGDKTALDNALSKATEDLKKNPLTQATADQDAQAIKDAINGLKGQPTNLDKLNQAISKGTSAQAGSKYANSSDESKAALDQAINAGQTAKTQSGLTQKEADEDASAIETAIKGLSGKDTDKTALTDAISKGEAAQKSDSYYNDANDGDKTALDNALSKATEDLKKNPLTQATADQDAQAIKDAINGLKGQPTNLDKLNQAISKGTSAQAGSKYANSSDESKAALDQAINAGQTAKTQSGLTQKEADEDASAIETAIKGLSGKDTDKTALTDAISKGEAAQKSDSYYNDANDGDKTALDNALSKATEDLKKNPLTQATADQDAQAIKDAINGLKGQPTNLDKLNQAISKGTSAQAGSKYANSSDESKAALDQAINAGQTAKTQSGLTQKEADEDASAIETAIKGLSGKDTDKTALTDAISKGEAAQKSDSYYNDANDGDKTALDNALSKATEDLKKNPLTQATADQDAQAIKDAINGLKGQPTNLDKLNQAISKGTSAQAGSKYANSSDESKAALDQAINAGQTAKTQSGLTQKEADEDASAIETAIKGLSGKDTDKTALTDAISKGEAAQKSDSYYNDANDGDKTALDNALSKATEDLKKNPLTQATADQDAQAIKDAINGLKGQPTNLDKLNQAISKGTSAQAGSKYANSSDESKAALDQAINAGQTAKTQSGLTQKEADEDASAIETAIKGLSGKDTDKTALTDAISKGEAAQKSDSYYNDANDGDKTALDNALSKATEDLKKNPLTQATADQDAQAIKDAINGLKGQPTNLDKLNQAISKGTSAQAGSKYANSSDESKAALDQAINAGQTAKTQSGLTQKEADEDASAIETAIKGLSGKDTDKTALTDAISKGEAAQKSDSYYNDANDGDKTALDNALSKATEDLKKNPLTQATADQDAQAIKDAINGLKGQPTNLDKLNQAISKGTSAQAGSKYANSSDESKAALDQAINAGQTAKTQSGLTQKEADEDASAIETAIKGLSGKDTDKTALTDAISKGEAAQKSDSYYNDANDGDKTALDNALSKATEDLKKNPLTQATADQDAQAIKDAINGLKGQPTNLDKLNQAISKGTSAQAGSKYANSSDESKAALDQAINAGQTAKTQSGLTQKEADEDASAIETAIKGLSGKDTDKTALTDAISKGEAAQKSDSYYNDANDGDKTALDNALSKATEDLKKNPLTQATADQDAQAIKDAINGLKGQPTNLDKLNQAISKGTSAQAGSKYANSSDESKAALDQAINAGQTAKTQSGLTQKEADEDASAIETAIKGLSGKDTDKTALTDAISKGEAAQKSDSYYNDANDGDKTALDNALSKATEDLKKNPLTQATADQDAQAIKDAINGLKGQPTNLDKLNQAISKGTSAQAGSKYANSSDESKAALDQAINAGQTAKTQSGLTQKEADEDASAIETAIKGLSGKDTDKTALTDAISKGEAAQKSDSYYNDANDGDKTALDNALSKATEDLKKNPLTQATADQDAQAIKDAINGLKGQPTNLDKLNQAISKGTSAQAGSKYANSSDESKAALDQAINAGQTAKTQSGLTQKEADEDASAIETAIKGLSGKDTDKTALTDAISKGEAAQKSDSYYNDANDGDKTALDNALSKATEDLKKNPLTQATADQDAQAIKDAINGLKGQPTNLDKLNQAISKGTSAQAGSKYANSSDESKAALDQAINAGQTAKTQSGLTQKEADEDASAIETAIKGLSGKDTDKTALTDAISKGEAAQKSDSYYNDANDGDKTALDNALSKATEDLKKNPLTQATADQDAQAIKDAINGLKGQPTNLDKLNQAISKGTSAQAGSKYANSSDESKAALDQAINAGQTAKTQSGLTQKEADEDASAIETAIKGLSGKDTDKTALTDAISKGEAAQKSDSYYNDANDGDKTALDNALSKATEDLKKNPLTQATADQDAQAIKDAINGLKGQPTNLDKLNQAISKGTSAQAGSKYANSSDESKAALDQAINAGQTAKTQSGLTQKEADEDASAIETAIKGLSGKDTDKTALTDAISKGEAAQKSDSYYNDANDGDKTALDNALSKATEDLKKNPLTQATADQDAQAIKDAINGLKGQPTNLDKLNQAISKGTSAQAGSKYANSSDESKAALDQAINAGQTAKTQSGLTQKEADEDASAIETAIKGLSGKDTDKTALTDAISKGEAAQKSDSYYNDANDGDKTALDNALSKATEDLKKNPLTQATADQDAQAIKDAINGLKGQPTNLDKLNQAISKGTSAQAGSKYANSSDESKAALDQAINAGQTAKTQSGLTQKEADEDASAIETAIKGLSGKDTDKTALTDAISKGEAAQKSDSYYNDANDGDKTALDNALSKATEDLKKNPLTQATADQDAQAIKDAINGLKGQPTNLDKLNQAISKGTSAQAGSKYANSSDESKAALDQAINAGQTAKTQSGLTQKEADEDASAIETAIKGLSGKDTDKTALTDAISKGEAAQKSDSYYNDANDGDKTALDNALSKATEDLKKNPLTQATADQDAQAIKDAINGLKGQPTNLDKLNQAISKGTSAQAGSKYANSSDESKAALDQAINAGQTAKTQSGLTQKEADEDASAIETAIKGLSGKDTDKTALTDAISKGEAAQKSDSYYNDANDGDKTALDNALSKATEDLKKNPLTQATADQDAQAIKDAINGLKGQPTNLDKLNQAISKGTSAQAGSKYANSSDESKAALDQAINAGQTAKTQSGLTQKEADEDASAIETAIKGLSGKDTDKTALTDAISKGEAAQKSDSYYNDANDGDKTALDNALSKATEDLKKNPLTQATADQDAQAIKDAINGLKGQPTNLDKLNQAISKGTSAQAGSKYANSSDESKAALDQAINAGQTAKTQSGLTQKEADEDASAIETAIKGLSGKDTDKTALTDAISKGEAAQKSDSYYNDANDGDKTALDNALSKATEDLKKNPLTQATADQDAQAIKDAINGLKGQPTNLDKLNQAISKGTSAQAGSKYANSSDESKAALDQAINAGQTAKTQSGLTQKEADEDASAIETAIKGLSGKDTDKTALTDAISKGEAAQKSDSYYNDANDGDKTALDNALSKATEDLKKNPLTQATADQDAQAIKDAINGLKGQPTNLDKLNQAISKGTSAQAGSKYANSSDESKAALDQAINAGQTAKTQSGLTQKEADEDASAIETAIKGLSGKDTDKTALTDAISKGEAAQKSDSYYNDANDGDKTALDNALSKATEDLKKNPLTQATADQDAQAIKDAINGLKGQPTNLDKLNQAISKGTSAQAGSKYANSSDESKAALDQAINAGQTAKTQSGLTQKEADEDASAIETAIKGLSGKDTDKTALTDAISKGEAAQKSDSYYNDANDGDKTALDNALSKATEDLKKNPLTQATADQDAQAIKDAINGLKGQPTNLDKLNQAISKGTSAQAGSKYANSSDESKAALDQAINAGQTAKTQSGLTQKEADEDASAIETAIKGLSGKDTDKTALTDAISKGEAAQKSDSYYNDANDGDKTALDNALSKATEDLKKNPLTQATADQDAQAIKDAINGLKGQPTNLDKLNQAISKGTSAQAGSKYANSSDESKAALDQAINAGQTAKTQSGLTQKEADEDASAIETAIKGLSGKDTDKTALTDAISKGEAAQKSDSYYNDANDGDKTALDNALSKATEDLKKNPLTQATADQDAQAIKDAINGLKGQPTNLDKLNQAISKGTSAQAGSKYANSSDESKAALDQAINAGQTAKTQSGLTQKEADEDASAIETAIKGLSGKDTDKTALTDAISKGEAAQKSDSYYNDANDGDKTALDNALSKATEDLKKNPLTQATADQDAQAIKDAINGLKGQPTNLDKLNQAISKGTSAQAGSKYANSSDESKAALDQAINAGQTAKTQSGLTQKEADEDASAIETAIKGLSGKDTDKTALTDAISKGEAAQKSDSYYNDANDGDKTALDNALSKATEDLKKNPLTQATADQDAQAIKDAINGLKGQPTNLDKLNQAISKGTSAQAGSKYANSSDESKAALDQAINAGQTAKTQSGLTQKEADEDASAIETAIKGLSGKDTDKTALTDAISKGKAAAKAAIDQAAKAKNDAIDASNLTAEEKGTLKKTVAGEVNKAKSNIDAATKDADVTTAKNTGVGKINNITVPTTSATKDAAKDAIAQAAKTKDDAIDASNLTAEEKDTLKQTVADKVNKAKAAIDAATKDADVKTAQTNGEKAINAVEIPTSSKTKNDANSDLKNTADAAKKAIDETSGLTADQKQTAKNQIDTAVGDAQENIKKASDNQGVANAKAAGKLAIDKVSANAAIDDALAKKIEEIKANTNLTAEEKAKLTTDANSAANDAKDKIQSATTNAGATKAGQDGKTAIEAVTVPADSDVKKNANSDLDKTADAAKQAIDKTSGLTDDQKQTAKDQIDTAVGDAQENINKASNNQGVADAKAAGKLAIDKVSAKAAIDGAAKAKNDAIDNTNGLTDSEKKAAKSQVATDAKAAKEAIDQADSNAAVTNAVNNGTVAINKDAANAAIDGALAEKNNLIDAAPNLTDEEKQDVKNQAKTDADSAKTDISKASTVAAVESAQTNGEKAINAVEIPTASKTKKNANSDLDKTADAAKNAIDKTSGLTADQKQTAKGQIDQAVTDAKEKIKNASDNKGVADATDAGKLAIDKVSEKAAIDVALNKKKSEINGATNIDQPTKDHLIKEATDAADKAKEAINKATTNNDVATEQTKGTNAIEAVKVPSLTDSQTAAKDAIDKALNTKTSEINGATNLDQTTKDKLIQDATDAATAAKAAIDKATTNNDVATEQTKGTNAIEAVKVPSLTDSQTAAKDAIDKALNTKTSEINGATNIDQPTKDHLIKEATDAADAAKNAIDQATTADAIKKAQDDGISNINNLNQGTDATKNKPVIPASKIPVGDQVTTVIITGDDYAYNDFYQVIIKANAVEVYTLPKGNLTKEKKLVHDTILTVLETKKIDGQVWYRIGTNRWIMAATTIKVGELENFKLKHLSKKTKTTAIVWVNKLAIYNNVNGKMTKKHLTRGTKVRIYAIATINDGEWYKIGKNKWIPAAGVHELTVEPL